MVDRVRPPPREPQRRFPGDTERPPSLVHEAVAGRLGRTLWHGRTGLVRDCKVGGVAAWRQYTPSAASKWGDQKRARSNSEIERELCNKWKLKHPTFKSKFQIKDKDKLVPVLVQYSYKPVF